MSKILCVHEKYYDYNSSGMLSACNHYLHKTVEAACPGHDVRVFYYDIQRTAGIHSMVKSLLDIADKFQPEILIFFTPFEIIHPLGQALQYIRSMYGTKLVAFATDSVAGLVHAKVYAAYRYYSQLADIFLCTDSTCSKVLYTSNDSAISAHTTADLKTFKPLQNVSKDIDVSFVGSIANGNIYGSRLKYLEYIEPILKQNGYQLYIGGGQLYFTNDESLSLDDYVSILNRSKIVINFSQTYQGIKHLKYRVMETMACKSFLMTEDCPDIDYFFDRGKDYCGFCGYTELADKLLYYLSHDDEREAIAARAYEKMTRLYNPCNVWGYIFAKLGYKINIADTNSFLEYTKIMDTVQTTAIFPYPALHTNNYIGELVDKEEYDLASQLALTKLRASRVDADTWYYLCLCLYNKGQLFAAKLAFECSRLLAPLVERDVSFLQNTAHQIFETSCTSAMEDLLNIPCVITAVVITKDNESTIARCLSRLQNAVDKIVVVDIGSQDGTLKIVNDCKFRHLKLLHDSIGGFDHALHVGITGSGIEVDKGEWVLFMYPDEYLCEEDVSNVRLATSLFSGQNQMLNVICKPLLPDSDDSASDKFWIAYNRLFPVKSGMRINYTGVEAGDTEMAGHTVGIRLHYDVAQKNTVRRSE